MNLRRLVICAALLAAFGAVVGHGPSEAPEAAVSVAAERLPAPPR